MWYKYKYDTYTVYTFYKAIILIPDLQRALSDQNTTSTEIQKMRFLIMATHPVNTARQKSWIIPEYWASFRFEDFIEFKVIVWFEIDGWLLTFKAQTFAV